MVAWICNTLGSFFNSSTAPKEPSSSSRVVLAGGAFMGVALLTGLWAYRKSSNRQVSPPPLNKPVVQVVQPPPLNKPVVRVVQRSKEEGDLPSDHDPMFNYVPAACLETALSVQILDNAGESGKKIDQAALQMADILERAYAKDNQAVIHDSKGTPIPLKKALDAAILHELRPTGNQVGRCLNYSGKDWFGGDGLKWLISQLRTPNKPGNHVALLTKIRAISGLGKFIYDNQQKNQSVIAKMLGKSEKMVQSKYQTLVTQIRHKDFSNPDSRSRSERSPIILGRSISTLNPAPKRLPGVQYGGSNGNIYVRDSFTESQRAFAEEFERMKKELSPEGIERESQVICDSQRPGILTDFAMARMPKAFQQARLPGLLKKYEMHHGNGINRWMQQGSYIREGLDRDLPIAGAHSGSAADILLALDCLNEKSIYGDKDYVESAGVLVTAWMTFGGYHSFIETFPIAQAAAANKRFQANINTSSKIFYEQFVRAAKERTNAGKHIAPFVTAYNRSVANQRTQGIST